MRERSNGTYLRLPACCLADTQWRQGLSQTESPYYGVTVAGVWQTGQAILVTPRSFPAYGSDTLYLTNLIRTTTDDWLFSTPFRQSKTGTEPPA